MGRGLLGRGWMQKGPGPRRRRPQEDSPRAKVQDEGPVAGLGWVEQGFVEELKGEAGYLQGQQQLQQDFTWEEGL